MRHTIERPPTPTDDRRPAWRQMRQAGASDQEAHEAAVVYWKQASAEAANAIAYAIRWSGTGVAPSM